MTKHDDKGTNPTSEKNLSGYGAPNYTWRQVHERLEAGITQVQKRAD